MKWIDGTIRRPEAEFLSREELRKLFDLPEEWIADSTKAGAFPPPITISSRNKVYSWEHAVLLMLLLKLGAGAEKAPPTPPKN